MSCLRGDHRETCAMQLRSVWSRSSSLWNTICLHNKTISSCAPANPNQYFSNHSNCSRWVEQHHLMPRPKNPNNAWHIPPQFILGYKQTSNHLRSQQQKKKKKEREWAKERKACSSTQAWNRSHVRSINKDTNKVGCTATLWLCWFMKMSKCTPQKYEALSLKSWMDRD